MSLLKSVLLFLTNQIAQFISYGISRSYFSGNFLPSFLLWYGFKILVKWRGGGTFLCLALSVNVLQCRSIFFFNQKLNILSFIFLIWMEQFWIRFSQKLTEIVKISIVSCVCMKHIMLCNCLCSSSCFSASAIWNIGEFRVKSYFKDHQRTNKIHGFRDSFVDLKIYNCY